MESDTSTWTAIAFLKELKVTMDGFDYRVLYNKKGVPIAIMYMTPGMRYNLLRYGDIMFLDSQKRQYNSSGWPYIGPVIKNSENKLGVTAEGIVTFEDIDMYTWMFKAMMSIEPRWNISTLKVIYADGFLTQKLLRNLKIEDTCILHGDYFHLMKEVWPK